VAVEAHLAAVKSDEQIVEDGLLQLYLVAAPLDRRAVEWHDQALAALRRLSAALRASSERAEAAEQRLSGRWPTLD
jgi:hypothetical protein